MTWRNILTAACACAFAAIGTSSLWAEPDTRANAQVFTRPTDNGAHLTFAWDSRERVPFSVTDDGNQVILHFDEPVNLRWGSALEAVSPYIKEVENRGGDTVILTLSRPSQGHYKQREDYHVNNNDKNGLDLVEMPDSDAMPVAASEEEEPSIVKPKRTAHAISRKHSKKIQVAKAKPIPVAQPAPINNSDAQEMATLAPAAGPTSPATVATPAPVLTPTPSPSPAAVSLSPPAEPKPAAGEPIATLPATSSPGTPSAPVSAPAGSPAPATITSATAAPVSPIAAELLPQKAVVPLPFKDDEPFAAIVWQKNLWLLNPGKPKIDIENLVKAGAPFLGKAETLSNPEAAILYMPVQAGISASIEKAGADGVQLVLSNKPGELTRAIAPSLNLSADGKASLSLPAGKAEHTYTFINPLTGGTMSVVPLAEAGAGIPAARSFVEFTLLPSAQGIAVQNLSDKVSVTVDKGKVLIAASGGLMISPETREQIQETATEAMLSRLPPTLFPYARWKLEDEKDFVPAQMRLLGDIITGTPDLANKARLKLLGLYLSEGLFPEALGMSNDILSSSLKFYQANKVSAMRGAAYLFMYRINDAMRDFSVPELKNDPESRMLLALCKELLGEGSETFNYTGNYDRYISHYPPSLIQKLAIIAADRSINRKDYAAATGIFDALKKDNYDEPVKKYIDYMRAKIFSETHEETEAAKIWEEQSKDLDDSLIRARAEFSLINMQLKSDKINHDEAEKRLEKLRIVWRGDSLEVNILTLLGHLYAQDKQYDKALRTMRDIVLYYPEVPEAVATAEQMEEIFVNLYNKGAADTMPPLDALSLFYEFRDLVPLGKDGDQMIRNLADRLVKIDLLDRAAELLDHQIRDRLVGVDRSRIAAQLAHIYLLNHQPEQALDALKTTGYGNLPADLQLQRLRLTAQALAQQGKPAKAIEVINPDNSPEGTLLRLSIYWDNKDWPNVVSVAEDILGNRTDPSTPLNLQESEVLLKLATAYVYEHDTGQLQYLRDYFTPLMKNNPNRDSFRFISSESGAVDYDNIANLDKDISAVKSYLAKVNDKPGKDGFSKASN